MKTYREILVYTTILVLIAKNKIPLQPESIEVPIDLYFGVEGE
jgi:hypothetical protein